MAVYIYPNDDYIAGLEKDIERVDKIISRLDNLNLASEVEKWRNINDTQRKTLKTLKRKNGKNTII